MLRIVLFAAAMLGVVALLPMLARQSSSQTLDAAELQLPPVSENTDLTARAPAGIYRWQDSSGQWHFGDEAPAGAEVLDVGETMTLPSQAFTGPPREQSVAAGGPRFTLIPDSRNGQLGTVPGDAAQPATSQEAMQQALSEISQRFPQFMEMSDQLTQQLSGQSDSKP